jgi:hypothetical protein
MSKKPKVKWDTEDGGGSLWGWGSPFSIDIFIFAFLDIPLPSCMLHLDVVAPLICHAALP